MPGLLTRYARWLHLQWPAGTVEKLPEVREDGSTNVPGLYVVGDLTGVPLLKFSADTGARAIQTIVGDPAFQKARSGGAAGVKDVVIIGGGVSGMAAALEARKHGLDAVLLEASEPFSTIVNFPKGKPIYTYPTAMVPAGDLRFEATVKETLIDELRAQTLERGIEPVALRAERVSRSGTGLQVEVAGGDDLLAHRVIVAIGRSGNFRKLGVPGEDLSHKVYNRLHDPKEYAGKDVLVVGGGDSALETAIAIARCGGHVTLSYRKPEFSRPKPDNIEKIEKLLADPLADVEVDEPTSERVTTSSGRWMRDALKAGSLDLELGTQITEITETDVSFIRSDGERITRSNDVVFAMIGREAPLDFFRRSGVRIRGEHSGFGRWAVLGFIGLIGALYSWKSGLFGGFLSPSAFDQTVAGWGDWWAAQVADRSTVVGTLAVSMKQAGFWFTALYTFAIGFFGIRRIRRRRTPYVTVQTTSLFLIQFIPLWLLPEFILPWLGYNGAFDGGTGASIADSLFPLAGGLVSDAQWPEWGHPRAYWHAYGLILAWPLNVYYVMTPHPMTGWLVIAGVQTFVLIPLLIRKWGKGAFCGWICSCGALAETMGDTLRDRMPHGPKWNKLNMVGQVVLLAAVVLAILRIIGWIWPASGAASAFDIGLGSSPFGYKWVVDFVLAGVIGTGFYVKWSGRVWCRFACPLAALMHVYARFSRFRILADEKKCISCNVCTSVCHQGIDIMSFANKGMGMEDPECVRCSACVQSCPTGVLAFGQVDDQGQETTRDTLAASPVQMAEGRGPQPLFFNRQMGRVGVITGLFVVLLVFIGCEGGEPVHREVSDDLGNASRAAVVPSTPRKKVEHGIVPESARTRVADHTVLDRILRENVRNELVDYVNIRDAELGALQGYLDAMARVDHLKLEKNDRFAFYTNVYNATVIYHVCKRYKPGYSVSEGGFYLFDDELVRLADRLVSLNHLEKTMMWDDFEDPRMHVCLVCAAISCPPILPRAYLGSDLHEVLDGNMRRFLASPRNEIDVANKKLRLSQLFEWYARDFGGADAIQSYVDRWRPEKIEGFTIEFIPYDWTLNITPE